ncbi:DUF5919 domain-containing protein [Streptomyces sp. NPDC127106]|uniref:DUF5919 domain-containing protein n=1 Tax=Streptomyces sp. NPDC127106 TaxID=3345360 RepID=UPI00362A2901
MIWPEAVTTRVKVGNDRELVHSYPYRSACPSTVWTRLVDDTTRDMFLSGYTNYFFWTQVPDFAGIVRRKVESGCRVRFLVGDPTGEITRQREEIEAAALTVSTRMRITLEHLARLGPIEGLEARFSAASDAVNHVGLSVFRFDQHALVTPHLARVIGHDSPVLHLRRQGDGGLFDRFRDHAEELWERGRPVQ